MVTARFHDLRNELFAAVDEEFAEPIQIAYLKDGSEDNSRQSCEIEAVLRTEAERPTPLTGGKDKTWNAQVAAHVSELSIDREAYPNIALRKGDKVRALARNGQPWFEVSEVDDRSHRRLKIRLGNAK